MFDAYLAVKAARNACHHFGRILGSGIDFPNEEDESSFTLVLTII